MTAAAEHEVSAVPHLTVGALVRDVGERLAVSYDLEDCGREARELVAALFDAPLFWPALNRETEVDGSWRDRACAAAALRAQGAPLAYCVGRAPFRHLTLDVDERVLIPRPETEQLVDVAMSLVGSGEGGVAVDVGTGSGAIALALASEARFGRVVATDVSLDALSVARRNAQRLEDVLKTPVEFLHGSLLAPLGKLVARLIVSNPPYIASPEAVSLPRSVRDWEPPVALVSGEDGMWVTARLVRQAAERLTAGGGLALEVDSRRAGAVAELAAADTRFTEVRVLHDLAGRERFVVARRTEDE